MSSFFDRWNEDCDLTPDEIIEGFRNSNEVLREHIETLKRDIEIKDHRIKSLLKTRNNQRHEIHELLLRAKKE